jgi:Domain of unknown function (DUF2703)
MNSTLKAASTRTVTIELLALDLKTCTRCVGSFTNIQRAIALLQDVLEVANVQVSVAQRLIESAEQARQYQFVSSPTIRVNGMDIALETDESPCDSCSDLCGCNGGVSCRVWHYQGEESTEAPVGLVVEAILAAIYRDSVATVSASNSASNTYVDVPDNLKRFFDSQRERSMEPDSTCCSASEQATCCEVEAKPECCGTLTAEPETCGCR